jgi:hypothetical protein
MNVWEHQDSKVTPEVIKLEKKASQVCVIDNSNLLVKFDCDNVVWMTNKGKEERRHLWNSNPA